MTKEMPTFDKNLAEFWNARIKAAGLRPPETRIPDIPDQSRFLEQWFDWHQGYRIVRREDGSETQEALLGENLSEVDVGHIPRTLEELREQPSRQNINSNQSHVAAITLETTAATQRLDEHVVSSEDRLFDSQPENDPTPSSIIASSPSLFRSYASPTRSNSTSTRRPSTSTPLHNHSVQSHPSLDYHSGMNVPDNMSSSSEQPDRPQTVVLPSGADTTSQIQIRLQLSRTRRLIREIDGLSFRFPQVDPDPRSRIPSTAPIEQVARTATTLTGAPEPSTTESELQALVRNSDRSYLASFINSSNSPGANTTRTNFAQMAAGVARENLEEIRELHINLHLIWERLNRSVALLDHQRQPVTLESQPVEDPSPAPAQLDIINRPLGQNTRGPSEVEMTLRQIRPMTSPETSPTLSRATLTTTNQSRSPRPPFEITDEGIRRYRATQIAQLEANFTGSEFQRRVAMLDVTLGQAAERAIRTRRQAETTRLDMRRIEQSMLSSFFNFISLGGLSCWSFNVLIVFSDVNELRARFAEQRHINDDLHAQTFALGTREEVESQGDDYVSPVGQLFDRAWARYRDAEASRNEMTMPSSLASSSSRNSPASNPSSASPVTVSNTIRPEVSRSTPNTGTNTAQADGLSHALNSATYTYRVEGPTPMIRPTPIVSSNRRESLEQTLSAAPTSYVEPDPGRRIPSPHLYPRPLPPRHANSHVQDATRRRRLSTMLNNVARLPFRSTSTNFGSANAGTVASTTSPTSPGIEANPAANTSSIASRSAELSNVTGSRAEPSDLAATNPGSNSSGRSGDLSLQPIPPFQRPDPPVPFSTPGPRYSEGHWSTYLGQELQTDPNIIAIQNQFEELQVLEGQLQRLWQTGWQNATEPQTTSADEHGGPAAPALVPPEKVLTKEEMMRDMQCHICYEQLATIACLPCGESTQHLSS